MYNNINVTMFFNVILSPLDQFEIRNLINLELNILGNIQISLTNIGLYLTLSAAMVLILNLLATNYNKIISNA
jgi:F-type H+-transporting ATPase subunit a